jgi:hypothetical protein
VVVETVAMGYAHMPDIAAVSGDIVAQPLNIVPRDRIMFPHPVLLMEHRLPRHWQSRQVNVLLAILVMDSASRRIIAAVSMATVALVKSIATRRHAQPSMKERMAVDG